MENDVRTNTVSELIELINKGNAHVTFEKSIDGLPKNLRTQIPYDLPYSIWQLVEHIRITQKDIVDFCINDNYQELDWPAEYWGDNPNEVDDTTWDKALEEIRTEREKFFGLLKDENNDLFEQFDWGDGQTLFREAVLTADHNAYHTAEIVVIRRLLKAWK